MSTREDLERRIREQRVLEANKKGLVGASGKIGTVLAMLGQEVVGQDSFCDGFEESPEDAMNSGELMRRIPIMEMEHNMRPDTPEWSEMEDGSPASTRSVGMHFDGLGMGMHMEIMYSEEKSELSLTHKGFLAYREVMGEVETYVPNEEWEGWIERLYKASKKKKRSQNEDDFKRRAHEAEIAKEKWWDSLRKRWGSF